MCLCKIKSALKNAQLHKLCFGYSSQVRRRQQKPAKIRTTFSLPGQLTRALHSRLAARIRVEEFALARRTQTNRSNDTFSSLFCCVVLILAFCAILQANCEQQTNKQTTQLKRKTNSQKLSINCDATWSQFAATSAKLDSFCSDLRFAVRLKCAR